MVTPDDPRHGRMSGYSAHRKDGTRTCQPCRDAAAAYERERDRDIILGRPRRVDPTGFIRRLNGLMAIGWSLVDIADGLDTDPRNLVKVRQADWVTPARHADMVELFERWSMQPPTDAFANRRRIIAARKGYLSPLAWDDIDHDATPPTPEPLAPEFVDEIAVLRAYEGDTNVHLTFAERCVFVSRWLDAGRSYGDLENLYGLKVDRYVQRGAA